MILSTQQLIQELQNSNPTESITEDRILGAIQEGRVEEPASVGQEFAWTQMEVRQVAEALGLVVPEQFRVSVSKGVKPRKAPTGRMTLGEYREWLVTQPADRILVRERSTDVTKPEGLSDEAMELLDRIWSYPTELSVAEIFSTRGLGFLDAKGKSRDSASCLTELIRRGLIELWVVDEWHENPIRDAIMFISNFDPNNQEHLDEVAERAHSLVLSSEAYTPSEDNAVRLVPVAIATPEGSAIFEKSQATV